MIEWHISRNGAQEGPMTAKQVGAMLANGELKASDTFAWKEGMTEWMKLAESGVLAEASLSQVLQKPSVAKKQSQSTQAAVNPYATPATGVGTEPGFSQPLEYPGIGRLAYVGFQIAASFVTFVILIVGARGAMATDAFNGVFILFILVTVLAAVAGIYLGVKRVQNLGMSGWAILWSLVPIMSIWIAWRMFACPSGYDHHKQLDTAGKVLTGLLIGMIALGIVLNIVVAASGAGNH